MSTVLGKSLVPVRIQARTPFFTRPVQRQRWGDEEPHAVVPWNDLFFDLFYVAAAYNLGNIIVNNPTGEGILYFAGCFFSVHMMWLEDTFFEARYIECHDVYHRCFHVSFYLIVATAVLHIRPVEVLSKPSLHVDMFLFSLSCVLANLFHMARYIEVILFGIGDEPACKNDSKRQVYFKLVPTVFYLVATVIAGLEYYRNDGSDESTNDIPIILLCCAVLAEILWWAVYLVFFHPHGDTRKQVSIPFSSDYIVHRYGEWTMLMLGECILSLLIVEVVSRGKEYYVTFYTGIVSVCLLMYLYFFSGPSHSEGHDMYRHVQTSFFTMIIMQFYTAGIVILGATYKLMMYEYTYENVEDEFGHRFRMLYEYVRSLSGNGGLAAFSESVRRQQIAYFYCFSLGIVWMLADIFMLMHKGLRYRFNQFQAGEKKYLIALCTARCGLIAFIGTLWIYVTEPHYLASIGLCCIVVQVLLRIASNILFPHEDIDGSDDDDDGDMQKSDVMVENGGDDNAVSSAVQVEPVEGASIEQHVKVENE